MEVKKITILGESLRSHKTKNTKTDTTKLQRYKELHDPLSGIL